MPVPGYICSTIMHYSGTLEVGTAWGKLENNSETNSLLTGAFNYIKHPLLHHTTCIRIQSRGLAMYSVGMGLYEGAHTQDGISCNDIDGLVHISMVVLNKGGGEKHILGFYSIQVPLYLVSTIHVATVDQTIHSRPTNSIPLANPPYMML